MQWGSLGDEVLLDTEHTPLPSRSLLFQRWMGPYKVLASTAPNTYRLELPEAWRAFDGITDVERPTEGGAAGPRPTVQELPLRLKFKISYGRPLAYLLVRWMGCDATGDTSRWKPLDSLTGCAEAISRPGGFRVERRRPGGFRPRAAPPPAAAAPQPAAAAAASAAQRRPFCWQASPWTLRLLTGGGPDAGRRDGCGSAAPWRASARALPFRMS